MDSGIKLLDDEFRYYLEQHSFYVNNNNNLKDNLLSLKNFILNTDYSTLYNQFEKSSNNPYGGIDAIRWNNNQLNHIFDIVKTIEYTNFDNNRKIKNLVDKFKDIKRFFIKRNLWLIKK
jgi:hypothetical protein